MDKYDAVILDIILNHTNENGVKNKVKLPILEKLFWKTIEITDALSITQGRVGERITKLYIDGLIENKQGYYLTKRGKHELSCTKEVANAY